MRHACRVLAAAAAVLALTGCLYTGPARTWQSSFESVSDFDGFYIVPQAPANTTNSDHALSMEQVHTGTYSHKAWITAANPPSTPTVNNNHRAYPTVQLYKTEGGAYRGPVLIALGVWIDLPALAPGQWFSFATLDHTTGDVWDPVLVNLSDQGFVHLMHVPYNGQGERIFQTDSIAFPMRQWVKLTMEICFNGPWGHARIWQDDVLVSEADVKRGYGFSQAHFGLYAPPEMAAGVVYNDDLVIREDTAR